MVLFSVFCSLFKYLRVPHLTPAITPTTTTYITWKNKSRNVLHLIKQTNETFSERGTY